MTTFPTRLTAAKERTHATRSQHQSDLSYRGTCEPAEAARLSDSDPSVVSGRLAYDVMEWWVRADSLAFPLSDRPVGERRSMPDD